MYFETFFSCCDSWSALIYVQPLIRDSTFLFKKFCPHEVSHLWIKTKQYQLACTELNSMYTRRNQVNSESKDCFIAVILKLSKWEDHSTLDMEISSDRSSLQSTLFTSEETETQGILMFEDDQKPSYLVRKLDLGPKSPVFPFNVEFLLLDISNCNVPSWDWWIFFTKSKMCKKKPTVIHQTHRF